MELHRAHLANSQEFPGLNQPDRVVDDDGRQCSVRQIPEKPRKQQHRGESHAGSDNRDRLRVASGGTDNRRLRSTSTGGHRAQQCAPEVTQAGSDQLAVRIDRGIAWPDKGTTCGNRFGKAHQRDPERTRYHLFNQCEFGQCDWG
ncbi:hypothetical protein D3C71_1648420 [compost metagenome]